ncbi:MAG: hypothetical protein CMG78_09385 [Marinobacter sp.]|nr:hypothetical protein [Marinobacter sp.]|tara:strand:+ start:1318 stop:1557 length:240 start_codon:yes stop_codon:yes gene_type:complete
MTDITEHLRAEHLGRSTFDGVQAGCIHMRLVNPDGPAAADEIERLRAAIRAALDAPLICHHDRSRSTYGILEAALRGQG